MSLRHVALIADRGVFYSLRTYATPRCDYRGQTVIGYVFTSPTGDVLFEGEDFSGSPLHADDSDETLRSLLSFLTLRPGDTDADYFDAYTDEQLAFASDGAEFCSLWADRDGPAFADLEAAL